MRNKKVSDIAFSSVFTAMIVVVCSLASLFPTMSLAIVAIAGVIVSLALFKCGYKYAMLVYIASSVLALLLTPSKECAVYFVFLFGHYPMLKVFLNRIPNRVVIWLIKLAAANVLYGIVFLITTFILGIIEAVGAVEIAITIVMFNAAFVLYDICLDRIMLLFLSRPFGKGKFR